MDDSKYTVFLREQLVIAPVGWHEWERSEGVRLLVSVAAEIRQFPADQELENGLNYTDLCDIVNRVSGRECMLLETLAENILQEIYQSHPNLIRKISVEILKQDIPHPGFNARGCGVKLERNF